MAELVGLRAEVSADSSKFRAGIEDARRSLNSFAGQSQSASRAIARAFDGAQFALGFLGLEASIEGVTRAVAGLVNSAAQFERAMGSIRALTGATADQLTRAEQAIRRTGLAFNIGARNANAAAQELVRAGVSISDLSAGALDAAVIMAQATGGTYADAATIAARATQVFRLETEDMADVVQGAAGVINSTAFDLGDYNLALQQGGAAARDAGLSLQDFNALLALTATALGSSGSDTGTASRTFLARLVPQSEEARAAMEALQLRFYDAQGAFIGLDAVAEQLRTAFAGLSDEQRNYNLVTIFGVDAQRQAIALMNEGADGVRRYRDEVIPAANAADMAQARTQGFAGAVDGLKASFEELGIVIGESGILDFLTALTNWSSGQTRNLSRGIEALTENAFRSSPIWRGLQTEGRRIYHSMSEEQQRNVRGDAWYLTAEQARNLAVQNMGAAGIMEYLSTHYATDPATGERARLADHALGRRLYALAEREAYEAGAIAEGVKDFPQPETPPDAPPALGDGIGGRFTPSQNRFDVDPLSYEEMARAQQKLTEELERFGPLQAPILIEPVIFNREVEVYEAALRAADSVSKALETAFVQNDWSNLGDTLGQIWRQTLWDVFFGEDVETLMRAGAGWLKDFLWSAMGASRGPMAGGGMVGIIGDVLGAFGGFFADGGTLQPGQWGIAGENGPEPIFAGAAGLTVIPAGAVQGGQSAGGDVHVVIHANDAVMASHIDQKIVAGVAQAVQISRQMARGDAARRAFSTL